MPVVAVGLAVALDVGAIGALAAGTLTTLAAITAIGATVSAVGAVTHNKTLSYIGMGIGIVGAIGTLASGAGLFDNVTDLFGSGQMSAADTASLSADATAMSNDAVAGLSGAAGGASGAADITTALGGIDQAAINPVGAINATSAVSEGNAAAIATGGDSGNALAGSLSPGAADAAASTNLPGVPSMFDNSMLTKFMPQMPSIAAGDAASEAGGIMSWANKNPMLAFGALQAGGAMISGLTNPMTPAQIDSLNSQSEVNRATAELLKRQMANQNAALPTATVASPAVTGRVEQPGGLINNSAPASTALITGAPNTGAAATKQLGTV